MILTLLHDIDGKLEILKQYLLSKGERKRGQENDGQVNDIQDNNGNTLLHAASKSK